MTYHGTMDNVIWTNPAAENRTAEPAGDVADEILDQLQKEPASLVRAMRQFPGRGGLGIDLEKLVRAVLSGRFEIGAC